MEVVKRCWAKGLKVEEFPTRESLGCSVRGSRPEKAESTVATTCKVHAGRWGVVFLQAATRQKRRGPTKESWEGLYDFRAVGLTVDS